MSIVRRGRWPPLGGGGAPAGIPGPPDEERRRGWVPLAVGSQVAALVLGGVTNLFYARILEPEELGQLALVLTLAGLAMVLTELGLHNWLTRAVAAEEVGVGAAAALTVKLAPALAALVAGAGAGVLTVVPAWRDALGITAGQALLVPELAVALALYQASLTLTQGTGAFRLRAGVLFTNALLTVAFTAVALLTWGSVVAAVHATAAAYVVAAVWFIARAMGGEPVASVDPGLTRQAVHEARPIWFNTLLSYATATGDTLIARSVLSLGDVGYYLVIKKVAIAGLAPLTALLPMLYARMSAAHDDTDRVRRWWGYQRWLAVAFAAGMVVAGPWIVPVMGALYGERFADRHVALLVLAGALWLQATHDLLGYLLAATKAFTAPLVANSVVAGTSITLAVVLGDLTLSQFGMVLAAAHALGAVVMTATARRRRLDVPRAGLAGSVVFAAAGLGLSWTLVSWPLAVALPVAAGALLAVAAATLLDTGARERMLRLLPWTSGGTP